MGSPNGGVQDAERFAHVLLGFGAFFKCGEFYIHDVDYDSCFELRQRSIASDVWRAWKTVSYSTPDTPETTL